MDDKEISLVDIRVNLHEQAFVLFEQGKDEEAFECMLKSAKMGDVVSQYYVGCYYEQGCGVKQDYIKAAEFYEMVSNYQEVVASEMPFSPQCDAEFAIGMLYEQGLLPNSTHEKASEWFEKAIKHGYKQAFAITECKVMEQICLEIYGIIRYNKFKVEMEE